MLMEILEQIFANIGKNARMEGDQEERLGGGSSLLKPLPPLSSNFDEVASMLMLGGPIEERDSFLSNVMICKW